MLMDHKAGLVSCWRYPFQRDSKRRVAILIDQNEATYHAFYDLDSLMNEQILLALQLVA